MQFYPEEVLIPWASRRLGVPVKWTEDRREHFIGSTQERGQIHEVSVGVDDAGRILALETRFLHDAGAYCPYGLIIAINTAAQLPGPYRLDNYRYEFTAVYTNTVPTSPYRGAGRPHGVFVMERVIERVSRALDLRRIPRFGVVMALAWPAKALAGDPKATKHAIPHRRLANMRSRSAIPAECCSVRAGASGAARSQRPDRT